jgi:ketosteroid isomerase-like protein
MGERIFLQKHKLRRFGGLAILSIAMATRCHQAHKENSMVNQEPTKQAIAELRAAYAAFSGGGADAAVRLLDPQVEWVEPIEFPSGGANPSIEGAKRYLAQSRAASARGISEPEQFIPPGDRIGAFVRARVLPKDGDDW